MVQKKLEMNDFKNVRDRALFFSERVTYLKINTDIHPIVTGSRSELLLMLQNNETKRHDYVTFSVFASGAAAGITRSQIGIKWNKYTVL